jgi:hypothetical protein
MPLLLALLAGCQFDPKVPEATVVCSASGRCPSGMQCVSPASGSGPSICCRDAGCLSSEGAGTGGAKGKPPPRGSGGSDGSSAASGGANGGGAAGTGGTPGPGDAGTIDPGSPAGSDAGVDGPNPAGPDALAVEAAPPPDLRPVEPPPQDDPALTTAAIVYLRFDDMPQNQTWRDGSGRHNDAVLHGADPAATTIEGRYGGGVHLTGGATGGWLELRTASSFDDVVHGATIAAWIHRSATDSADGAILARRASSSGGQLYTLEIANDRLRTRLNSANGYNANLTASDPLPRDRWIHVAMTYDQHNVRLFVDGMEQASQPYQLALPSEVTPVLVGATEASQGGVANTRLAASLDEVLLYARALTSREIGLLAARTRPPFH